jgi:hypothetical protein
VKVRIGIPWHDSGSEHRARSFRYVARHVSRTGVEIATGGPEPWSRAAARNALAGCDADVVILHDADMIAPIEAYGSMVDLACTTGRLVVGFREYRALDESATLAVLDGADPFTMPAVATLDGWSVGGIIAITPTAWAEVGGMDPRFVGWGCEDFAFAHACALVLGPIERVETPAVHLWHPHGNVANDPQIGANGELMARYTACTSVEQLREVQREH